LDVFALGRLECRRRVHDGLVAFLDLERTEDTALARQGLFVDLEPADETLTGSKVLIADLMTHRAGNAIVGQTVA
jgi:hypothetical protein